MRVSKRTSGDLCLSWKWKRTRVTSNLIADLLFQWRAYRIGSAKLIGMNAISDEYGGALSDVCHQKPNRQAYYYPSEMRVVLFILFHTDSVWGMVISLHRTRKSHLFKMPSTSELPWIIKRCLPLEIDLCTPFRQCSSFIRKGQHYLWNSLAAVKTPEGISTPSTNWNSSRTKLRNCHTFQWKFVCSIRDECQFVSGVDGPTFLFFKTKTKRAAFLLNIPVWKYEVFEAVLWDNHVLDPLGDTGRHRVRCPQVATALVGLGVSNRRFYLWQSSQNKPSRIPQTPSEVMQTWCFLHGASLQFSLTSKELFLDDFKHMHVAEDDSFWTENNDHPVVNFIWCNMSWRETQFCKVMPVNHWVNSDRWCGHDTWARLYRRTLMWVAFSSHLFDTVCQFVWLTARGKGCNSAQGHRKAVKS